MRVESMMAEYHTSMLRVAVMVTRTSASEVEAGAPTTFFGEEDCMSSIHVNTVFKSLQEPGADVVQPRAFAADTVTTAASQAVASSMAGPYRAMRHGSVKRPTEPDRSRAQQKVQEAKLALLAKKRLVETKKGELNLARSTYDDVDKLTIDLDNERYKLRQRSDIHEREKAGDHRSTLEKQYSDAWHAKVRATTAVSTLELDLATLEGELVREKQEIDRLERLL
ncbi:hypothetical protein KZJ38_13110 [Paraburkholderia edwinii]|uniref:Uncharacterized protein n=1 Tax=Paraburkholderia edwinii TaxID=2861782 RepID=A0ABX8UEV5_9BURK|nr:hypothetical protein [Paraburkholderia edwinii]QYD67311.1 hypothetical protein KZJ38_13110 [Paraburkholderia edwinii]